jgi:O-antigen ligase
VSGRGVGGWLGVGQGVVIVFGRLVVVVGAGAVVVVVVVVVANFHFAGATKRRDVD